MMMPTLNTKSVRERFDALLKTLIPAVHEICILNSQLPKGQQNAIFHQFYDSLIRGAELVKQSENINPFNIFLNYRHASQILKLEKQIHDFMLFMPAHVLLDVTKLMTELRNVYQHFDDMNKMLKEVVCEQASMATNEPSHNSTMIQQMASHNSFTCPEFRENSTTCKGDYASFHLHVGLEKSIGNVKELLFRNDVSVVGVQCMGGGGKTTLALSLSDDLAIKDYFRNQVHFLTVSQSPNLKIILETMWDKIVRRKRPEFENMEDARKQLQDQLLMQCEPTLVILDDVWSRANLEILLFEGPAFKTLVTTRDTSTIPINPSTRVYQLPLLGQDDSLALFCFWVFGQTSIPDTADANLVKEVQSKCKGLPLALKVIGSSLRGEPSVTWECAKNRLSKGLPISDYHKDALLKCLETSIDLLDDVARECFLDMGSFPKDTKICVEALLDIWVYVRKLEWQDAFIVLLELASKNLLNLTSTPGSQAAISRGNASELYFYQHDLIRDLALYLGSQGPLLQRKRLVMARKERSLPSKWKLLKDTSFDAQIVSIHTGSMDETHWFEMNLPETEALILIFSAREYILPPFLKSMKKLKFLMVFNYGPNRATVKGLESLSWPTELRSIRLERLIAPSFNKSLHNTEKLSLTLCEGLGNPLTFNNSNLSLKLPMLQSFNMDHCIDLEELPPSISGMVSALMLSITNCHQVYKLPYELGNLSSLRVLRLSALPCLEELPASIGKLGQLEYLDISLNECLRGLPDEIGQLKKLMEMDMRECSRLRKLPRTVCALTSLKHVICDDKIGKEWVKAKGFAITELRVEIVAPVYSLDWLDN